MNDEDFSATSSAAIFDDCRVLSSGYSKICFVHCQREAKMCEAFSINFQLPNNFYSQFLSREVSSPTTNRNI